MAEPSLLDRPRLARAGALGISAEAAATVGLVALLLGLSILARTRLVGMSYWIDEGLSLGISAHPLAQIPTALQQDGSPPLYYMLLHVWVGLFGTGEVATHWLSTVFGLLCVPAALWAGWSLFGRRAGLYGAALAALTPFLNWYSAETRMYSLLALLALLGSAAFLHAFVFRRRRYVPLFALCAVAMLYTHNWAAFFLIGAAAAGAVLVWRGPDRRGLVIDGAIVVAITALLYAPWVPTLLSQIAHTGAPWTVAPTWRSLVAIPRNLFGTTLSSIPLYVATVVGLVLSLRRLRLDDARSRALVALLVLVAVTIVTAFAASKATPAWAARYYATFLGPLLILLPLVLVRAGRLGLVAIVVMAGIWTLGSPPARDTKSNARTIAAKVAPILRPGDTVLTTWPEQVPILHHYLPPGLLYATPIGPVADPSMMDWRDAVGKFRRSSTATTLEPLLARMPVGAQVALIRPNLGKRGWAAPWTRLVRQRTYQWTAALAADRRFKLVDQVPRPQYVKKLSSRLRALVYVKLPTPR